VEVSFCSVIGRAKPSTRSVAALRSPNLAKVARTDHQEVLRLLAKRNSDLARTRNRTAWRLHALLAEFVLGGIPGEISSTTAELEADRRPLAHRYFGPELGDAYVARTDEEGNLKFSMRPARWWSVDYTKSS
jgi:hypothetical protein